MKIILPLIICVLFISCSQEKKKEYRYYEGPIQGTMFHIKYEWSEDLSHEIDSLLQTFNSYLSNYDDNSIISRINNNSEYEINDLVADMIETSIQVNNITEGAFDITIAPVVNLWGFGWNRDKERFAPDSVSVDSALRFVGMDKISIVDNRIIKSDTNVMIIGNAIAQGLSADYVSEYFFDLGLENFLVEIGGEIYCHGKNNKNEEWKVGIDKPVEGSGYDDRENQIIVMLSDRGIATSGNYRKFIDDGNKKLGHTIDPRTGYPAENSLLSVSVISRSAMFSDAYATAFMVLGLEKSMEITEQLEDMESYFIFIDENGEQDFIFSSGFEKFIYFK